MKELGFDTNEISEIVEKDYRLISNEDYFDLEKYGKNLSELKKAIFSYQINDFIFNLDQDILFPFNSLAYDSQRRRLLNEIAQSSQSKASGENEGDELKLGLNFGELQTSFKLWGRQDIRLSYGSSLLLYEKDQSPGKEGFYSPVNLLNRELTSDDFTGTIENGPQAQQDLNIRLSGKIGRKVNVDVTHTSSSRNNTYNIEYEGDKREFVQSIKFGNVSINAGGKSQGFVAGGSQKQAFGVNLTGKRENLTLSSSLSVSRGLSEVKTFSGDGTSIKDTSYIRNRFFLLPDTNVSRYNAFLYQQVTVETNGVDVITVEDSLGSILFFRLVEQSKYEITLTENNQMKIDLKANRFNGYSILFYQVATIDDPSNFRTGIANNSATFIGTNLSYNRQLIPLPAENQTNFAVLTVPDNVLSDLNLNEYYELRNHYFISTSVDISSLEGRILDRAGNLIDSQVWQSGLTHVFAEAGKVTIDLENGFFFFEATEPLRGYDGYSGENYRGLYDIKEPNDDNHNLSFEFQFNSTQITQLELGRFGIIPGSVVVFRNGKVLKPSEYRVTYSIGKISFNQSQPLQRGENIVVSYEYQPFALTSQRFLFANRIEWVPRKGSHLGASLGFSLGQLSQTSPEVGQETSQQFAGDIDTSLDIISLIQRRRNPDFSLIFGGEYALSVLDPNNKGLAKIEDFQGTSQASYSVNSSFNSYYLTANPQLEAENRVLGKSYFVDFNQYSAIGITGTRVPVLYTEIKENQMQNSPPPIGFLPWNVNLRPYEVKPGPFEVQQEGFLDPNVHPNQSVLVFDYDFSDFAESNGYVSFITPISFFSDVSRDFTRYREIEIIYKLMPTYDRDTRAISTIEPGVLGLSIDVGSRMNEDFDLDGVEDRELSSQDPTGFDFNYYNSRYNYSNVTKLGGGFKGWNSPDEIEVGNGRLDTENLVLKQQWEANLGTNEAIVTFPSADTIQASTTNHFFLYSHSQIPRGLADSGNLSNGAIYENIGNESRENDIYQEDPYYKIVVRLDSLSDLTNLNLGNLVRINLKQIAGSGSRGRLLIESIKFKEEVWDNIVVDGNEISDTSILSPTIVGTLDDAFYNNHHLGRYFRKEYEDLHGVLLSTDFERISENALEISYNINGIENSSTNDKQNGKFALVEQNLPISEAKNIYPYKTMKFFLYNREETGTEGADFIYRFGIDRHNFYELRIPWENIPVEDMWTEYSIRFKAKNILEEEEFKKQIFKNPNYFVLEKRSVRNNGGQRVVIARGDYELREVDRNLYQINRIGSPSLFQVRYFAYGIDNKDRNRTARGIFYVNEIYVDEDEIQLGHFARAGLTFKQNKDLKYKNIKIISDVASSINYNYKDQYFSSLDLSSSGQNSEQFSFNAGLKLLDAVNFNYDNNNSFIASEYDDNILPKELQTMNRSQVNKVSSSFSLPYPVVRKFVPDFNFSITDSENKDLSFQTLDTSNQTTIGPTNEVKAEYLLNNSRSYNFSIGKNYRLTSRFSLYGGYSVGTSFSKRESLFKNIALEDLSVFSENVRFKPKFIPNLIENNQSVDKQINPVLNLFPDPNAEIIEKQDFIEAVNYSYSRSHSLSGRMNLYYFNFNSSFSHSYGHNLSFTNDKTRAELNKIGQIFDSEQPFTDITSLDEFNGKYNNINNRYSFNASWTKPIEFKGLKLNRKNKKLKLTFTNKFFQINRIDLSLSYNQTRNNFIDVRYLLTDTSSLLQRYSHVAAITNDIAAVSNYFSQTNQFQNIGNNWNLRFSIPFSLYLDKFPIKNITPFNFNRSVSIEETGVLYDNPDIFEKIKNNNAYENPLGAYGRDSKEFGLQDYYWGKALEYIFPFFEIGTPWYLKEDISAGLLFLTELLIDTISGKWNHLSAEARIRNVKYRFDYWRDAHRINLGKKIAENNYELVRSDGFSDPNEIAQFTAHSGFDSTTRVSDTFAVNYQLRKIKYLSLVLPDSFSYNTSLETSISRGIIYQNDRSSLVFSKSFSELSQLISKSLPKGDDFNRRLLLNGNMNFSQVRNFNTKTKENVYTTGLSVSIFKFSKNLDLKFRYGLRLNDSRKLLRYHYDNQYRLDGLSDLPRWLENIFGNNYLGIGEWKDDLPAVPDNEQLLSGINEYLNIGENETWYTNASQLGTDTLDLIRGDHNLSVTFDWHVKNDISFKIGKKSYTIPRPKLQSFTFDIQWNQLLIPQLNPIKYLYQNKGILQYRHESELSAQSQDDPIAIKNLSRFIGSDRVKIWSVTTDYQNDFPIANTDNFEIGFNVRLGLVGEASYETYAALLYYNNPTIYNIFNRSSNPDISEGERNDIEETRYIRTYDSIRFVFQIGIHGAIRF